MFSIRLFAAACALLLTFACQPQKKEKQTLNLVVSDKLREIFPQLKPVYAQEEIPGILKKMTEDAEPACRGLHNQLPGRFEAFKKLSPELWTKKYNAYLSEIIAGCYNFFTMNDLSVKRAFTMVREFYPGVEKDCYSVGFAQLYFMETLIGCRKWTAIDIDWRILDLHHQVLSRYFKHEPLKFNELVLRWSANFADEEKIRPREEGITVDSFCYWPTRPDCRKAFERFPRFFPAIRAVELQLAFLHDISIQPLSPVSVVHVSNATDPGYTSKVQFEQLLNSLVPATAKNHKAVVVYHSGGSYQFAIYEVSRAEGASPAVTTKCRDNFAWSKYYKDRPGVKYRTYFDNVSLEKNPRVCTGASWEGS